MLSFTCCSLLWSIVVTSTQVCMYAHAYEREMDVLAMCVDGRFILQMPKMEFKSLGKPSMFAYPPPLEEKKNQMKEKVETAVLSITTRHRRREVGKKKVEEKMDVVCCSCGVCVLCRHIFFLNRHFVDSCPRLYVQGAVPVTMSDDRVDIFHS